MNTTPSTTPTPAPPADTTPAATASTTPATPARLEPGLVDAATVAAVTLREPCYSIDRDVWEHPHFPTLAAAEAERAAVAAEYAGSLDGEDREDGPIYRAASPCVVVACECGRYTLGEEDGEGTHFPTFADATSYAADLGFWIDPAGWVVFDAAVARLERGRHRPGCRSCLEAQRGRPVSLVAVCGSTRFRDEIATANRNLTLNGHVVLAPAVFGHAGDTITDAQKARLDELHLVKIALADWVFVVNPHGYIGGSTRREIAYATATGKQVVYLVDAGYEPETFNGNTSKRENADPNVWHVVSDFQYWLDRLGLKVPRALCGASLAAGEGEPDGLPADDAPLCPACRPKSSWTAWRRRR